MKYKKTRVIPKKTEEILTRVVCGGCKKEIYNEEKLELNLLGDVTIRAMIGDFFRDYYELDCCIGCFLKVVKPALEDLGFVFAHKELGPDGSLTDLDLAVEEEEE